MVRAELLKLVHVPLWDAVSAQRRDYELQASSTRIWAFITQYSHMLLQEAPKSIQKQWRIYCSQKQKGKSFTRETNFLPFIMDMVRARCAFSVSGLCCGVLNECGLDLAVDDGIAR